MRKLNNKGTTLVEMLIVIVILGIIGSVAYPMIFMNEKITTGQIDESAKRNEILSLESFLKNDLRNSISFGKEGTENDYIYTVNIDKAEPINYKKLINDKGEFYISRQVGTEVISFQEVIDINLKNRTGNNKLIEVVITITDDNGDPYFHELNIARWEWLIKKDTSLGDYGDFLLNESFIMGTSLKFKGTVINGPGSTILLRGDLENDEISGNANIKVSNIFIEGDLETKASMKIGSKTTPGEIIVTGDVELGSSFPVYGDLYVGGNLEIKNSGTIYGDIVVDGDFIYDNRADIYGDIYVGGDFEINNTGNIYGKIYVQGDLIYENGAILHDDIYVGGNLEIKNTGIFKKNVYVKNDVILEKEFKGFSPNSRVEYGGEVEFPGNYDQKDKFFKVNKQSIVVETRSVKVIPNYQTPQPRDFAWYTSDENEYDDEENGDLGIGSKIISQGSYSFTHRSWPLTGPYTNVVIVALGGDITLDLKNNPISGVLYAPEGKIIIKTAKSGQYGFTGLAIGKDGFTYSQGGSDILFKSLAEFTGPGLLFESSSDYPFIIQE